MTKKAFVDQLDKTALYDRATLYREYVQAYERPSRGSFNWLIQSLAGKGLYRVGYNAYSAQPSVGKAIYAPIYQPKTSKIMGQVVDKYSMANYVVFESVLLNEFLNHLLGKNVIFFQVERDFVRSVFFFLQDLNGGNVLLNPSPQLLGESQVDNTIVVLPLTSRSPVLSGGGEHEHQICLEKLLVDVVADKVIASLFEPAELPVIYQEAESHYLIDKGKMLNYARRRNKLDVVTQLLG